MWRDDAVHHGTCDTQHLCMVRMRVERWFGLVGRGWVDLVLVAVARLAGARARD